MSFSGFSLHTFGFGPYDTTFKWANIYKHNTDMLFYGTDMYGSDATALALTYAPSFGTDSYHGSSAEQTYLNYTSVLREAGITEPSTRNNEAEPIIFPLLGRQNAVPNDGMVEAIMSGAGDVLAIDELMSDLTGEPGAVSEEIIAAFEAFPALSQKFLAIPMTMPSTTESGFCDPNRGFGFAMEAFMSGFSMGRDLFFYRLGSTYAAEIGVSFSTDGYSFPGTPTEAFSLMQDLFAPGYTESLKLKSEFFDHGYPWETTAADTLPSFSTIFTFSTVPHRRGHHQYGNYIFKDDASNYKYISYYAELELTNIETSGNTFYTVDAIAGGATGFSGTTEATSCINISEVRPITLSSKHGSLMTPGDHPINSYQGFVGARSDHRIQTYEEVYVLPTKRVINNIDLASQYPIVLSINVDPIDGGVSEGETALFQANVQNGFSTDLGIQIRENLKDRFKKMDEQEPPVHTWIENRVKYISDSLAATLSLDTPKSARVRKQISPDIVKRDYTTFIGDQEGSAVTSSPMTSTSPTTSSPGGY